MCRVENLSRADHVLADVVDGLEDRLVGHRPHLVDEHDLISASLDQALHVADAVSQVFVATLWGKKVAVKVNASRRNPCASRRNNPTLRAAAHSEGPHQQDVCRGADLRGAVARAGVAGSTDTLC